MQVVQILLYGIRQLEQQRATRIVDDLESGLENARILLRSLIKEIEEYWNENEVSTDCKLEPSNNIEKIELICNKFHRVAQQMRSRYDNRATLEIKDEYDVQDLFHCQLISHGFDDIRQEEWTPSYAGGCSRIDFLLKSEQIFIEIKKTREGLKNKKLAIFRLKPHVCIPKDVGISVG